ncbi:MAG: hypothetical protein WCG01_02330 [bacterium]
MILKIKIEVSDELEAYKVVSELGFEHQVVSADLDGHIEKFDKQVKPCHFLKNAKTNELVGRAKTDDFKE